MKKTSHKKKGTQSQGGSLDQGASTMALLVTLLAKAGLNKYQVTNRIKVDRKVNGLIDLEIDLHRLTVEEVDKVLSKVLNSKAMNLRTITLIHGFNHGMALKDYIKYDYVNERIEARSKDAMNEGKTVLRIKPWDKSESRQKVQLKKAAGKVKIQASKGSSGPAVAITDKKNEAKFILEMIKENVRAGKIQSKVFNHGYDAMLSDQEQAYCEAIYDYGFDVTFFLNYLMEFCVFQGTTHMKIRYKKKSFDELVRLIHKLTFEHESMAYVIVIEVGKALKKQIEKEARIGANKYFDCELKNQCLVISNRLS